MHRPTFAALLIVAVGSTAPLVGPARAEPTAKSETASKADKSPATVAEHLAAAKTYRDQAARERREVEKHRFMIQRRKETPGQLQPSDWYYQHCQKLIDAATEVASVASDLADYHEKQAQDLRRNGKVPQ